MSQNGRDSNQDGSRPWACRNDQNGMSEIPSGDWSCINEAADDFERAWKEGPRPAIEDYLGGVAEPRRSLLLHELLRVERELRLRDGEVPRPEDYYERLPGDRHVIEAAFRRRAGSPPWRRLRQRRASFPPFSGAFWRDWPKRSVPPAR
jgi:hypothetical protein